MDLEVSSGSTAKGTFHEAVTLELTGKGPGGESELKSLGCERGMGNSKCKGPEAAKCLKSLRNPENPEGEARADKGASSGTLRGPVGGVVSVLYLMGSRRGF